MSLLRIRGSLADTPERCQWALVNDGQEAVAGEGLLTDLPHGIKRVQLVIPAAQVLITRARLPRAARRHAGSVLAYAVENETACEPDANQVSWLGPAGADDVLAVVDKAGLERWRAALSAAGVYGYEIHSETLLLPWEAGEWSLAWNGREGFVRSGALEGVATDCGDHEEPPLSLCLMLREYRRGDVCPAAISVYATVPDVAPDVDAWTRKLGIPVRVCACRDWRTAPSDAGVSLTRGSRRWLGMTSAMPRLRPAAWVLSAALAVHAVALVIDWTSLAREQRNLRQQMEARFRTVFPDAIAVVDPALQMRRKLAEARHATGQPDGGDFLPMIVHVAAATRDLPAGTLRTLSYESGRLTLELSAVDEAGARRIVAHLRQANLSVEMTAAPLLPAAPASGAKLILTVRAS